MSESVQAMPTGKVTGWQYHKRETYPCFVEVPMNDGAVVIYQIKVALPGPKFETADRVMTGYERRAEV